jgi:hypothetical protein
MKARIYDKSTEKTEFLVAELFKYSVAELTLEAKTLAKCANVFNLTAYITDSDCIKIIQEIKVGYLSFDECMLVNEFQQNYDFENGVSFEFDNTYLAINATGQILIDSEVFTIQQTHTNDMMNLQRILMELHRANIKDYEGEIGEIGYNSDFDRHSEAFQLGE